MTGGSAQNTLGTGTTRDSEAKLGFLGKPGPCPFVALKASQTPGPLQPTRSHLLVAKLLLAPGTQTPFVCRTQWSTCLSHTLSPERTSQENGLRQMGQTCQSTSAGVASDFAASLQQSLKAIHSTCVLYIRPEQLTAVAEGLNAGIPTDGTVQDTLRTHCC